MREREREREGIKGDTRPSDRDQIWHACAGRYGTGSHLKQLTHPTPGGFRGLFDNNMT